MKFVFICGAVTIAQLLCFVTADRADDLLENELINCGFQYLKDKGKLDDNINFTLPHFKETCEFLMPTTISTILQLTENRTMEAMPNKSECLMNGIRDEVAMDSFLKVYLIYRKLTDNFLENQLVAAIDELKQKLEKISLRCQVHRSFVLLFQQSLTIKNNSLVAVQRDYCLTEYVANNFLLNLTDVQLNPYNLETDNVNCANIIGNELRDDMQKTCDAVYKSGAESAENLHCAVNVYKNNKMFDWVTAWKVSEIVDMPTFTKYVRFRVFSKIVEISMLISECKTSKV